MSTEHVASPLLRLVGAAVRSAGYRRRGRQFAHSTALGHAIIHVQTWTRPDGVRVTANVGIYSSILARFLRAPELSHQPSYLVAHWGRRIGNLCGSGTDRWWDAEADADVSDFVSTIVEIAVPRLQELLDPRALRDSYLAEVDWTIGIPQTLLHATVLTAYLREFGRADQLLVRLRDTGYPREMRPDVKRLRQILEDRTLIEGLRSADIVLSDDIAASGPADASRPE